MAEKKVTTGKVKLARGKRMPKPKLLCAGKLSNGIPCPKTAEQGKTFCRWHDPEDETWRGVYARLEKSTPKEKGGIVIRLIEDHPEHRLILPERDGVRVDLSNVDLSPNELPLLTIFYGKSSLGDQDKIFSGANLRFADLRGAILISANLNGAFMEGANLQRADFMSAQLQGAYLNRAKLQSAHLEETKLQGAYLSGANLQGAFLYAANLHSAHLEFANLERAQLNGANLQQCELTSTNLQGANLTETKIQDLDLTVVESISNVYISGAWLDRTRLWREQLGGSVAEEQDDNYEFAKRAYLALKQNFDDLGDYEASSWAYRKERRMEKLEALQRKKYFKFFSDTVVEWLCDYGESVWRVIGWIAFLLLIIEPFSLSLLGGFRWDDHLARDYFALSSPWNKFWFSYWLHILYSLGGLSTSNFSGLQPATVAVKLVSSLFSIIGIFLVGLLGFVAGNRIRRS